MSDVEARLKQMGHEVPEVTKPAANYVPWVVQGDQIIVAGQVPMVKGTPAATGKVGSDHTLEEAQGIARICALNIIGILKAAAKSKGRSLDDIRILRLGGFVNCAPGFTDIHLVINGASDLIAEAFGERGIHARSAIGTAELPLDVPVEVEAIACFV